MGYSRFWLKMADVESKSIPHELPSSHWLKATGQCVLERYLSATMVLGYISGEGLSIWRFTSKLFRFRYPGLLGPNPFRPGLNQIFYWDSGSGLLGHHSSLVRASGPSNPAVVRSSPEWGRTYMCLPYRVNSTPGK